MKKAKIYFAIILVAPRDVNGNSRKGAVVFDEKGDYRYSLTFGSEGLHAALLQTGQTTAHAHIVKPIASIKVSVGELNEAIGFMYPVRA